MRKGAANGFTLLELLVVVGMITILAALILPAIETARKRTKQASCVSQLRQIGLALTAFKHDHNDRPPAAVSMADGGVREFFFDAAGRRISNPFLTGYRQLQVLSNELESTKLLLCPADRLFTLADSFGRLQVTNCTYYVLLARSGTAEGSDTVWAADGVPKGFWEDPFKWFGFTDWSAFWIRFPHGYPRGNALYADGHVEQLIGDPSPGRGFMFAAGDPDTVVAGGVGSPSPAQSANGKPSSTSGDPLADLSAALGGVQAANSKAKSGQASTSTGSGNAGGSNGPKQASAAGAPRSPLLANNSPGLRTPGPGAAGGGRNMQIQPTLTAGAATNLSSPLTEPLRDASEAPSRVGRPSRIVPLPLATTLPGLESIYIVANTQQAAAQRRSLWLLLIAILGTISLLLELERRARKLARRTWNERWAAHKQRNLSLADYRANNP